MISRAPNIDGSAIGRIAGSAVLGARELGYGSSTAHDRTFPSSGLLLGTLHRHGRATASGPSGVVTLPQASPAREIGLVSGKIFTFRFRFKRGGAAR